MSKVSYKTNDPKGWCCDPKRGAAMGRGEITGDPDYDGKLVLRRIRLNSGGYDSNGTYFGFGQPLYWFASDDGTIDGMIRANSRTHAKQLVKDKYKDARFYN